MRANNELINIGLNILCRAVGLTATASNRLCVTQGQGLPQPLETKADPEGSSPIHLPSFTITLSGSSCIVIKPPSFLENLIPTISINRKQQQKEAHQ